MINYDIVCACINDCSTEPLFSVPCMFAFYHKCKVSYSSLRYLYWVSWTSLTLWITEYIIRVTFVYKAILSKLPAYLRNLLCLSSGSYELHSSSCILFVVPIILIWGKNFITYYLSLFNNLLKNLRLVEFISIDEYEAIIIMQLWEACVWKMSNSGFLYI